MDFLKRVKQFKSSVLGLALIIFAGVCLYNKITEDRWILGGLFSVGLGLLFTGDKFIERLEKVVFGRILFKDKEDGAE